MAVSGWVLDKSAATRVGEAGVAAQLAQLVGRIHVCSIGLLEQLYSARSASDYDSMRSDLLETFLEAPSPPDLLSRALRLQRDLAHHHGMWHRTPIPDLLIAETALHNGLGVLHVDADFDRIGEVRPLTARRLG